MEEDGQKYAMPMLAERRRKVKYILNPRHTHWTNDSSRFGVKYMEKLGWKSGQGIGANLQGLTDCIKVSYRSDCKGLGFKGVPEDALPHQDNFSDLLAQLATTTPPAKTKAEEGNTSLELKSRQSRSRVHYSKFTRSKDVSRYSGNDLSCILGKPAKQGESYEHSESNFVQRGDMRSYFRENLKANSLDLVADDKANKLEGEDNLRMGFGFNQVDEDAPVSHVSPLTSGSETTDTLNGCLNKSRKSYKTNNQKIEKNYSNLFPQTDCKSKAWSSVTDFPENIYPVSDDSEIDHEVDYKEDFNTILKVPHNRNRQCVEVPATKSCLTLTECREVMLTDGELNKSIKKKQKKNGLCLEMPASESCLPIIDCSEAVLTMQTEEAFNENAKKKRKKRKKNYECLEVPASEGCLPITDCSEALLTMQTEEAINENAKKKRKKPKNNYECLEVPVSEMLSMETKEEFNKNIKKRKKRNKNDECMDVFISKSCLPTTDYSETVLPMETEVEINENVKKKRKKNYQCMDVGLSTSDILLENSTPERPVHIKVDSPIIEVDGVKYINGISQFNKYLKRRQEYSHNATKLFNSTYRERAMDIFDLFPGSNITSLPGYVGLDMPLSEVEGIDQD